MKKATLLSALTFTTFNVQAAPLSPREANHICHQKAVRAAHFVAESAKKFKMTFEVSTNIEISTPIIYHFTYPGINEFLYTVVAYAYPDDHSCIIGSVTNNVAGND